MEDKLFWHLKKNWSYIKENNELQPVLSLPPIDKQYWMKMNSQDFSNVNDLIVIFKNGKEYEVNTPKLRIYYDIEDPRIGYNEKEIKHITGIHAFGGNIKDGDTNIVNIPTVGSDLTNLISNEGFNQISNQLSN